MEYTASRTLVTWNSIRSHISNVTNLQEFYWYNGLEERRNSHDE